MHYKVLGPLQTTLSSLKRMNANAKLATFQENIIYLELSSCHLGVSMPILSGLSGNELYCLRQKGFDAGNIVVGNSVFSIGFIGSIGSSLNTLAGGEVIAVTEAIHEGRQNSYQRMIQEVNKHGGVGAAGVSSELIFHGSNVEFLSVGSTLHKITGDTQTQLQNPFSASADGQELYCQMDCGFTPLKFVFGNVAYSIGLTGGVVGSLRSLVRGEVKEYSDVFHTTRHLALERITAEARSVGANAVLGIQTSILPIGAMQEMLMIGTASHHPLLPEQYLDMPISSDLTNEEMWNVIQSGYCPIKLVLGVSVFSVGIIGGIAAVLKGFVKGEISELTTLIYEAREYALKKIADDAATCNADDIIGIKTYVYDLGGGIIELMAIGTAIKKMPNMSTVSPLLLTQAIIRDKDTFFDMSRRSMGVSLNQPTRNLQNGFWMIIIFIIYMVIAVLLRSNR